MPGAVLVPVLRGRGALGAVFAPAQPVFGAVAPVFGASPNPCCPTGSLGFGGGFGVSPSPCGGFGTSFGGGFGVSPSPCGGFGTSFGGGFGVSPSPCGGFSNAFGTGFGASSHPCNRRVGDVFGTTHDFGLGSTSFDEVLGLDSFH